MTISDLLVTNIDFTPVSGFLKYPKRYSREMVLFVNKPVGSAFAGCSKIPKMVAINIFETFGALHTNYVA